MFFVGTGDTFIENIAALPSDIGEVLLKNLTTIRSTVIEIDKAFTDIGNNIGAGREQSFLFKKVLTENLTEVIRLGGDVNIIVKQQQALNDVYQTTVVLNKEYTDDLYAVTKVTGKEAKDLFEAYANVGKSVYQVADDMGGIVQNMQLIGLNAKTVTAAVVTNMDALSKFNFQNGVQGLTDMAAQSAKLRVDMKTGLDFANKLYDPDAAQEFVQNITNLGIQTSSALKDVNQVRYMALNDPMKLQEELAKSLSTLVDESGNIGVVASKKLEQISQYSGLQLADLKKMAISMSEIQKKQELINEAGINVTDPELERLENILQKGKTGEFEVKFMTSTGEEITKAIKSLSSTEKIELERYLEKQTDVITKQTTDDKGEISLKDLAFSQQSIGEQYKKTMDALEKVIPAAIAGSLSGEKIVQSISDVTSKTSESLLKNIDKYKTKADDAVTDMLTKNKQVIDKIEPFTDKLATIVSSSVNVMSVAITDLINKMDGVISGNSSIIDALKKILGIPDYLSLPGGGDRFIIEKGTIGKFDKEDVITATPNGPKTKEEAEAFINAKPTTPVIPTTNQISGQPLGITNVAITDLASKIAEMSIPRNNETKKVEASFEPLNVNFNMSLKIDGATNIDQRKLEETLDAMLKTNEVAEQIRTSLKGIQGISFK